MTELWLMPDYGGTVLWKPGHDVEYAIDHHDYGLPPWLVQRLDAWVDAYGRTRHPDESVPNGFRSEVDRHGFLREGRALRDALAAARLDHRVIFRLPDHL